METNVVLAVTDREYKILNIRDENVYAYRFMPPKENITAELNEIIIIKPQLVNVILKNQITNKIKFILELLEVVESDEEDTSNGTRLWFIKDELNQLKNLIKERYSIFLTTKELKSYLKKLSLIDVKIKKLDLISTQIVNEINIGTKKR